MKVYANIQTLETETQSYWETNFKLIFHIPETFVCFGFSPLGCRWIKLYLVDITKNT